MSATVTVTLEASASEDTVTEPPTGVWKIALSNKFPITWEIRILSILISEGIGVSAVDTLTPLASAFGRIA